MEPVLENTMNNFMDCSTMMFGSKVKFCVTYKMNQVGFTIYTRMHQHNFKVCINKENYEGVKGTNLSTINQFAVGFNMQVMIYNNEDMKLV
jgi:hypothetical protein